MQIKERLPSFSVIVATYRRPTQRLPCCLRALANQDYPRDRYEVIVVDDGSPVSLRDITTPFEDRLNLKFVTQSHAGPAKGRNTGAMHAKGEYLAFTDDDCEPAPDWLGTLAAQFKKTPECILGGHDVNALPENLFSAASQLLIDYLYLYFNKNRHKPSSFFISDNFALPSAIFRQIDGFDVAFFYGGEDREICSRLVERGCQMIYVPEALVYHAHYLTFSTFLSQHTNYGVGGYLLAKTLQQRKVKLRRKLVSFFSNMLFYPFSQNKGPRALLLAVLLVVSQVAYGVSFFVSMHTHHLKHRLQEKNPGT